jgi:hypothetical protein
MTSQAVHRVGVALALTLFASLPACGPAATQPELTLSAKPRTIDAKGQVATLTVTAIDAAGKPGTGLVRLSSPKGSLETAAEFTLNAGELEASFSCTGCAAGAQRITAEWVHGGVMVTATTTVSVTVPAVVDAGPPDAGSADAGPSDSGTPDAGGDKPLDGGVTDGGFFGAFVVTGVSDKIVLLEGTIDAANLIATLKTNTSSPQPAVDRPITFTATVGSFESTSQVLTKTVNSDDAGVSRVKYYVGTATKNNSPLAVVITAEDAQATVLHRVVKAQTLTHDKTDSAQLNIKSTQIGISTNVQFIVRDELGVAVPGVDVTFELAPNSAAGSTVAPVADRTNTMGIARTTLSSGDSQGTAIVTARVLNLAVVSPAVTIIIGRPSDQRLSVDCARKSLGARENPAGPSTPRNDQSTVCTASGIGDRNGNMTPYPVAVNWQTEVGTITSSQALPGAGRSSTTFNTAGALPLPTTPLPGEPFNGADNPRDSFVTIIAIVDGEEQFWDGSGASNNIANGQWDRGEWWVDLPEPFVDSNDNGTWDPGEPFTDTDRFDCATGLVVPKNENWDGPNGCWDAQTKIWRATHVVYTDTLVSNPVAGQFIEFSAPIPALVPLGLPSMVGFRWYDRFFNRLSLDSPTMTLVTLHGARGTATLTPQFGGEAYGHDLRYVTTRGEPISGGGFTDEGDCEPLPADAGSSRCLRGYRFVGWKTSSTGGILSFAPGTQQPPMPDGGTQGPTLTGYQLRAQNGLVATPSTYDFSVRFQ